MAEALATLAAVAAAGLLLAARDPRSFAHGPIGYAASVVTYAASMLVASMSALDEQTWWLLPLVAVTASFTALALVRPVAARAWVDGTACGIGGLSVLGTIGVVGGFLGT